MNNASSIHAILPILIVLITGMVVLVGDACLGIWHRAKMFSAVASLIGIAIAAAYSIGLLGEIGSRTAFNGAIIADDFAQACNLILLLTAGLAVLLGMTYLENRKLHLAEYYVLVLFSSGGAMLMAAAGDLIVLFVAIEILSVALYVMAGFARTEERSEEAALKYFLLGAFAGGFLLYGIALIYGGSAGAVAGGGTTNLAALSQFLRYGSVPGMLIAGIALVLVGLAFKAALVPFHMWTPDVYEGAPTSVTAYMAASAKIGAFAAIFRLFNALLPIHAYWLTAVQILAVVTMFGGNILAVTQDNVKRMLAYSSIAHAGYLMVAVSAMAGSPGQDGPALDLAHSAAFRGAVFYLLAYTVMTMGAFAVLIWLSRRGRDVQTMKDLKGLAPVHAPAAYVMLVFMLSLGGIPPTVGFMGKWMIFYASLASGQLTMAVLLALASVISIYYYLRVVWMMCFSEPEPGTVPARAASAGGVVISVLVTAAATLLLGVAPNLLNSLMAAAATVLRP